MAIDKFTQGYINTALWACSDVEGGPSFEEQGLTASKIRPSTWASMICDCKMFQLQNKALLRTALGTLEEKGRDFFLARLGKHSNRIGEFFGLGPFDFGRKWTEAAQRYETIDLELWDGQIVDPRNL